MNSCIVIGTGVAGLAAAMRLKEAGVDVRLFESSTRVGGRVISVEWGGFTLNPGAQFITTTNDKLLHLVKSLGLQDILEPYAYGRGLIQNVLRDGRIHSYNYLSLLDFLRWGGVSFRAKLSMLKLMPVFLRYRMADTYRPHLADGEDECDLQAFLTQHANRELLEYYVSPTLATYCSWETADISLKMFGILMATYLNQKLYTISGGIGNLTRAFASRLNVELNTRVTRIEQRNSHAIVHIRRDGSDTCCEADAVILAVPGSRVPSLLADMPSHWQRFYSTVSYSSAAVIFRAVRLGDAPLPHDLTLPRAEGKLTSFIWFVDRCGDMALVLSELQPHLRSINWPDDDLLSRSREEFLHFYPDLRDRIEGERVFRWPHKVPNFRVGYLDALRTFQMRPRGGPIYACGDYLVGPSIDAALSSGWQCAGEIMQIAS